MLAISSQAVPPMPSAAYYQPAKSDAILENMFAHVLFL